MSLLYRIFGRGKVNDPEQERHTIVFGATTTVLNFPASMQNRYENHLKMIRYLKKAGVYPKLRVFALMSSVSGAIYARRLVVTGSLSESQKHAKVYYTPEAENFVTRELKNDWNAINAESCNENFPAPGCSVDLRSYERHVADIKDGKYFIEDILD
jgi:hypothetical protein